MKVTEEMVQKAHAVYWRSDVPSNEPKMRRALEAALADIPEPVPGPFVLSESVALRELHYLVDELEGEQDASVIWNKVNDRIAKLLQRTLAAPAVEPGDYSDEQLERFREALEHAKVCRYLPDLVLRAALAAASVPAWPAAPAVEPLSDELREDCEWSLGLAPGPSRRIAAELLRRCPRPTPKQRTPGQVCHEAVSHTIDWADLNDDRKADYEKAAAAVIAAHEASK